MPGSVVGQASEVCHESWKEYLSLVDGSHTPIAPVANWKADLLVEEPRLAANVKSRRSIGRNPKGRALMKELPDVKSEDGIMFCPLRKTVDHTRDRLSLPEALAIRLVTFRSAVSPYSTRQPVVSVPLVLIQRIAPLVAEVSV